MPQPTDPARYPLAFEQALLAVQQRGEITIPSEKPAKLRNSFYGFFRALRLTGRPELADSVTVLANADSITLQLRDASPAGREVAAALQALYVVDNK